VPSLALADITAFIGANTSPSNRLVKGAAFGGGLLVIGFEFEYAATSEDLAASAPSLKTGIGSVLLQTPASTTKSWAAAETRGWPWAPAEAPRSRSPVRCACAWTTGLSSWEAVR
jgi:hypothetical protein